MAIIGNASDLANRPATSSSTGQAGTWRPLLVAVVVVAIVFVVATAAVLNRAKVLPAAGSGEIEDTRAGVSLIFANSLEKAERLPSAVNRMIYSTITPFDHRYDNVDKLRGNLR